MQQKRNRPDKDGTHRGAFEKNKKKIYATQTVCGICGKPVDFSLKYPHPLSACIDHIIPIAKGGHPSDIENMQLAHWTCNRQKSDKLITRKAMKEEVISNRVLPHTFDWLNYRSKLGDTSPSSWASVVHAVTAKKNTRGKRTAGKGRIFDGRI